MAMKTWAALALVALAGVSVQAQTILDVIANNAPEGFGVETIGKLANNYISSSVNATIMNLERGTVFIPSDAAFNRALMSQGFKLEDLVTGAVDDLLRDHLIMTESNGDMAVPVEGSGESKTYTNIRGHNLTLTFDSNGALNTVVPSEEFMLRFGSAVNGSHTVGNVSVYYISEVIITKPFYDEWIGNGAQNLANALIEVDSEYDNILSILLSIAQRRQDLVDKFGVMNLNGTLFAPSNAAFEKLVTMVGFTQVDPESVIKELTLTKGLRELADAVLMYHFIPSGSEQPDSRGMVSEEYHSWDGTEFNTLLGQQLGLNEIANNVYTLNFMNNSMLKIEYGLNDQFTTNVTKGFADVKIITSNGYDWQSPVNNGDHYAHLHVINDVLLPLPAQGVKLNLDGFEKNTTDNPSDETYDTFKTILDILRGSSLQGVPETIELLMDTPTLRGALFVPSDAAIGRLLSGLGISQEFLAANPGLLLNVIQGHIVFDEKMNGTGNYPTMLEGYEVEVTYGSNNLPSKFERAGGGVGGLKNVSSVEGSFGPTAVGYIADLFGGTGNGYLHYVDEVIVPGNVVPRVNRLVNTPAGDAMSAEGRDVTGQNYANTETLLDSVSGLRDVLNGNDDFTVFWPSDEALEALASILDIGNDTDIFTLLQEKKDVIKNIMETYIVMESQYEAAGSLQADTTYKTRAGTYIRYVPASNTYIVGDTEAEIDSTVSSRKLLSEHNTGSFSGSSSLEGGDKTAFWATSAAITSSQKSALESTDGDAAGSVLPSVGLLAAALLALVGLST